MGTAPKLVALIATLAALASPAALAHGPGGVHGLGHRPTAVPHGHNGGVPHGRALGVVCKRTGASKSNEGDPEPGTPFSRCVRALAHAVKTACATEAKKRPEGDTEPGTPFSRCVRSLKSALRSSRSHSAKRTARRSCRRAGFDTRPEKRRCARAVGRALRRAHS
jgi:hypothetical protein